TGIVGKGIVDDEQLRAGIAGVCALFQVGDKRGVVIHRTLFDHISYDVRKTAIGNVNLIAGGPGGFIAEPVVEDKILRGARLQQVADLGVMRVVIAKDQFANVPDVNVVGLAIAKAVEGKFRELDGDGAGKRSVGENAFVVVVKKAIAHGQVVALLANSHTVLVNYVCTAEFDVLHGRVGPGYHPDAFALRVLPARVDVGPSAAHAADGQVVGGPGADVSGVGNAGINFDNVAGDGCRDGCARGRESLARPHLAGCRIRGLIAGQESGHSKECN